MPRSVLVIDDDADFRDLIRDVLQAWGHRVVGEAATVAAAPAEAEALRPDAILVDVGLPDGDGRDLAERFAALPWRPRVVLVSTDADAADAAVVQRLGIAGFIPKLEITGPEAQRLLGDDA